jgi:hypothetical protein
MESLLSFRGYEKYTINRIGHYVCLICSETYPILLLKIRIWIIQIAGEIYFRKYSTEPLALFDVKECYIVVKYENDLVSLFT